MEKPNNTADTSANSSSKNSKNANKKSFKAPQPSKSKGLNEKVLAQKQQSTSSKELQKVTQEFNDLQKQFKYLQAEFANFKKQSEKERFETSQYANFIFIKELLVSVLNDFNRAMEQSLTDNNIEQFKKGMEIIHGQFIKHLKTHGVEELSPKGEIFDPHLHEVLSMEVKDDVPENTILQVCKTGYKLNDRLIQPAQVIVSKKS